MKLLFGRSIQCSLLCALSFTVIDEHASAQNTIFLNEGKIEFEKKVNLHSRLDDDESWSELEKKIMPKFKSTFFNLYFNGNKTLYQPGRENPDNNRMWGDEVANENVILAQLDSNKAISQKKVFEQFYIIEDSTRNIKWKITDETRTIAGFNCRRANAIIMDSVYVVAFYTDEIVTAGGPESFNGLPGMILGISLPHQHVTWFATKVEATPVSAAKFKNGWKGKRIDPVMLKSTLKERMKDWGKYAQTNLEAVML